MVVLMDYETLDGSDGGCTDCRGWQWLLVGEDVTPCSCHDGWAAQVTRLAS